MQTTTTEENKRIARRVPEEIASENNLDLVAEVFAEDAVEHGAFGQESHSSEERREQMQQLLLAFPDFEAEVLDIVAEGDTVAMRVRLSGTHEGQFAGVEPTGKSFDVQNMVFTRIEDGKIVERWVQPDTLAMVTQLGIDPAQMRP
ncbi:MAG: ester cyclase [Halapricum sp.]